MITNEIKAKVFAMYLYQQMIAEGSEMELTGMNHMDGEPYLTGYNDHHGDGDFHPDDCKLILRTVDDLNIAEDIELCGIIGTIDTRYFLNAIKNKHSYQVGILKSIEAYQYLLSIGIDLPSFYLGGKTLIESGLAINLKKIKR